MTNRWRVFWISFLACFGFFTLWSFASPLASVPDEASHATRAAAVIRGDFVSPPYSSNKSLAATDVPKYVDQMHQWSCYAREPFKTAACMLPLGTDSKTMVESVSSAGTNSPVYYALIGWPTLLFSDEPALFGMRIVSAALCAFVAAVAFMQLSMRPQNKISLLIFTGAMTPMVLYLSGSMNPNGLEALSTVAVFITALNIYEQINHERKSALNEQYIFLFLSAALLVSAKTLGLLWLAIAVLAPMLVFSFNEIKHNFSKPKIAVPVTLSILAAIPAFTWFFVSPKYEIRDVAPIGWKDALVTMSLKTVDYSNGLVGIFGWLDTPSPRISDLIWGSLALLTVSTAGLFGARRYAKVFWVLCGFFLISPIVIQSVLAPKVGLIWQGRYMLAIFLCLIVSAAISIPSFQLTQSTKTKRAVIFYVVLLGIGQIATFVWVLRRYMVGLDGSIRLFITNPDWSPPVNLAFLIIAFITLCAITGLILCRYVFGKYQILVPNDSNANHFILTKFTNQKGHPRI